MDSQEQLFAWVRQKSTEPETEKQAQDIVWMIYQRGLTHGEESMLGIAAEWREAFEAAVEELNKAKLEIAQLVINNSL